MLSACSHENKTAFVNLNVVYDHFTLKKELESKLENASNARKAIMDSLTLRLQGLQRGLATDKSEQAQQTFMLARKQFLEKKQLFEEDNDRQTKDYDSQIWKQINQFAKDYGDEKGYDYIFGAQGNGTLMYAAKGHDITDELSAYINAKYKGAKP
jgi:Skp family chaperone for outer membrane proteins